MTTSTTSTVATGEVQEFDLHHVLKLAKHRLMPPDTMMLSYRGKLVGWLNTKDRTAVLMEEPWNKPIEPAQR